MKKSTDDLMKILRSKRSVDEYFDENDSEIFFGTLHELVRFFMARKGLEKAEVVRRSGINRGYCYEIISGKTTKNISRAKPSSCSKKAAMRRSMPAIPATLSLSSVLRTA